MKRAGTKLLVTDGGERPALAIVRSLARHGASVLVGSDRPVTLASASKYCARTVTYPSPLTDRDRFAEFVDDLAARESIDVVLPVTDVTTHAICMATDKLRSVTALAVPSLDAFEFVSDKWKLVESAARTGVPTPRTLFVNGVTSLSEIIAQVEYPAVVKPSRSRIPTARGWMATTVHYARSREELLGLYRNIEYLAAHPSLIQERIVGPGVGIFLLFDRGRPIAEFAHRRLREKPPSGGVSVLCESVAVDPFLRERALQILVPRNWHGVAMVEFKQDQNSGQYFLMEVNGRFWGSLQLAIDAGVDFPDLTCDLALGRCPAAAPRYRLGVKSRWLLGDLDHLLLRLFKSDNDLDLAQSAPSRWRALADFLTCAGPDLHCDTFTPDDPRPFLYELRQHLTGLWKSVAHRTVARCTKRLELRRLGQQTN